MLLKFSIIFPNFLFTNNLKNRNITFSSLCIPIKCMFEYLLTVSDKNRTNISNFTFSTYHSFKIEFPFWLCCFNEMKVKHY